MAPQSAIGNLAGFKQLPVQQPGNSPQLKTPQQTQPGSPGIGALAGMNPNAPSVPGNPFVQGQKGLQQNLPPQQKLAQAKSQGETASVEEQIKLQELKNKELVLKREEAELKFQERQRKFMESKANFENLASSNLGAV